MTTDFTTTADNGNNVNGVSNASRNSATNGAPKTSPAATFTSKATPKPATKGTGPSDWAVKSAQAAMRTFDAGGKVKDLTGREGTFEQWNRLANTMTRPHNMFHRVFNEVYELAGGGFHAKGMSLPGFLHYAQGIARSLEGHHHYEEANVFPKLAKRMEQFRPGPNGEDGDHIEYHRKIHNGLQAYERYLLRAARNPDIYSSTDLREIMDAFRKPLFEHLDQEVKDLGAESMIRHGFTLADLDRVPL